MNLAVSTLPLKERLFCFWQCNKKKIIITGFMFLIALIALSFFSYTFSAPTPSTEEEEGMGALGKIALSMIEGICKPDLYSKVAQEVNVHVSAGGLVIGGTSISGLGSVISGLNSYLSGIATTVAIILWFPSLASAWASQQFYAELLIKKFMILGFAIFLITNSMEISQQIVNAGGEITTKVGSYIGNVGADPNAEAAYDAIKATIEEDSTYTEDTEPTWTGNFLQKVIQQLGWKVEQLFKKLMHWFNWKILKPFGIILSCFVPWIMIKIITALASVFTISRAVEMVILITFSPIPFAIVGNDPLGNGAGARFIKNLFAVSFQGAVMLIIAFVCQAILSGLLAKATSYEVLTQQIMWQLIAVSAAEIGLLAKSLSISQKVFGLQ